MAHGLLNPPAMQRLAIVLVAAGTAAAALVALPQAAHAGGPSCFTKLTFISWVSGGKADGTAEASTESKAVVRRPHSLYKWDLGVWMGGMGLHQAGKGRGHDRHHGEDGEVVGFGGMGLQARYRMRRNWGLELSAGALHSEAEEGTERDMFPVTASLLYYLTPTSLFQIYGLAGLGVAPTRWYDPDTDATIGASTAGLAQAGVGVALDLHPLRLNFDIRGVGMKPSLGDEDGPPNGAVPCDGCRDGMVVVDAAREDPNAGFAGTSVHMGASIVF